MSDYLMQRAAGVLLVVGDIDELRQIRHSLQQAKLKNRLHHVGDAAEAKAYLRHEGPYALAPSPGLVLLDANLAQESGVELVAEMKTDPQLAGIPVIMLAGSESEYLVIENSVYAADGIIQKPLSLPKLLQALISVDTLSIVLVQSSPAE